MSQAKWLPPIEHYPEVTESLLQEIVRRIVAVGHPLKIVLFGSRGRGDARPDSDLDLFVVEESDRPRHCRSPRYYRALVGTFPGKDIVVWTPAESRTGLMCPMLSQQSPCAKEECCMSDHNDLAKGWVVKGDHDLATARQTMAAGGPF